MAMSTELNLFKLCSKPLVGLLTDLEIIVWTVKSILLVSENEKLEYKWEE